MNLKVNFFDPAYRKELPRTDEEFGINDGLQTGEGGGFAYTTTENGPTCWNAWVRNREKKEVQFVALDHNMVLYPSPSETYSLCDGMLYREHEWLAFVELKVVGSNWIQENIDQLSSTILLFHANHDYRLFKHRLAYAANRKHPNFHFSHKIQMNEFRSKTKFRLLVQNVIEVK